MKINSLVVAIVSIIVIFGGIFVAESLGLWQTESTKEPMKFTSGEFEGQSNPDDIRGSYSFGDIEAAFGVEAAIIAEAFGISADNPETIKAKDLEEIYSDLGENIEIGTGSVKKFVSLFTGLPYEGEDYLPKSAVAVLDGYDKWNDDVKLSMEGYIIDVDMTTHIDASESDDKDNVEHAEEAGIKGNTTVADAISYGITLEEVEKIMGIKIENENMLIRDICEQNGLNFGTIKELLSEKIE